MRKKSVHRSESGACTKICFFVSRRLNRVLCGLTLALAFLMAGVMGRVGVLRRVSLISITAKTDGETR
jgi:hypothetical protein